MKIPKDTSKLKKHLALMCDRLNKGGKLDLSSQTGEPFVQQQLQKAVAPLEPLSEMQEEEDETGQLQRVQGFFFSLLQTHERSLWIVPQLCTLYSIEHSSMQKCVKSGIDSCVTAEF